MSNKKIKCPMPQTHMRLEEAHRFWHEAEFSYQEPVEFTAKLNALIQALRNVTFIMQSELSKAQEFSVWYLEKQKMMREIDFMKWSLEARNIVVKKGDLEKYSVAHVKILTYQDNPVVTEKVSPLLSLYDLVGIYAAKIGRPNIEWDVVLQIERDWVVSNFSHKEVLAILFDTYNFLKEIIIEWHRKFGVDLCELENVLHANSTCEMGKNKYRVIQVSLSKKTEFEINVSPILPSEDLQKKSVQRYSRDISLNKSAHVDVVVDWQDTPWSMVNFYIKTAKTLLQKDGFHHPIFHFFKRGVPAGLVPVTFNTRPEKYLMMREIANRVKELGVDGVVFITEAWLAPVSYDKKGDLIAPAKALGREEILTVYIATADMRARSYQTIFTRSLFGKIDFGETSSSDIPLDSFMAPVFKVWKN